MLEEGPLDFVGRFWETVKPRDTAYAAGEHIGEIRKPGEKSGPPGANPLAALKEAALAHELPNVQEKVQERVQEVTWHNLAKTRHLRHLCTVVVVIIEKKVLQIGREPPYPFVSIIPEVL